MRVLALDHGTRRIGVALSDELKMIASPLEYIPAEPFAGFLKRLKEIISAKDAAAVWQSYLDGKTTWSRPWSLYVLNEWVKRNIG